MKIEEHIKELVRSKKTLFVCMGNLLRGDDGIGSYICHKILEIKQCDNILIVGSYLENALGKIIEKRPKIYHVEYTKIIVKRRPGKGRRKKKIHVKKVTKGWEIVRELRVCLDCYNKLTNSIQNV